MLISRSLIKESMYRPEHEKLEVYGRAVATVRQLEGVARAIPDVRGDLRDQLRRASTSIVLNLAEGANEFSAADKARFYRMARRSAGECLAILDIIDCVLLEPIATSEVRAALLGVMETLNKLVLALQLRR